MVKKGLLIFVALILTTSIFFMPVINAQTREYYFQHEWVKIWINQDGTIDLLYDLSLTLVSGGNINYVLIGQPTGDFTIGGASDQYGRNLATSDASEGRDYKVKINLFEPLTAGETINFSLTTNVARMIWEDTQNQAMSACN